MSLFTIKPSTELVTNGGFDTNSDWSTGTGWSISAGVLVASNSNGWAYQNKDIIEEGKFYQVTYTISNYSQGGVAVRLRVGPNGSSRSANGTYTEILQAGSDELYEVRFASFNNATLNIDNVSVKEIPPIQSDTQWFFDDFSWANGTRQSIHNNSNWQQLSDATMSVDTNEKVQTSFPGDLANTTYRLARIDPTQVQFSDDHYAEVIVDEDDGIGFDFRGPAVRMISGSGGDSGSGYILRVDLAYGGIGRSISRVDSGSSVALGSVGIIPKEGDRVGIQAVGSNISSFLNGQLIETVVDSTYTTGQPGMFYKAENSGRDSIDNFFAKDVVSGQTGKPFKIS